MSARVLTVILLSLVEGLAGPPDDPVGPEQTGVVKSSNQAIPGASVSATQGTTTVVTTTDQSGHYSLRLGPGVWAVGVTMVGFQPAEKSLTVANAAQVLDFNLQLKESPIPLRRSGSAGAG